jgi:hypothetical protein
MVEGVLRELCKTDTPRAEPFRKLATLKNFGLALLVESYGGAAGANLFSPYPAVVVGISDPPDTRSRYLLVDTLHGFD